MADTTTELEVLDEIVDVLGGQSGQHKTVVPVLEDIRDLLGGGGGGGGYNPALSVGRADALTGADETAQWAQRESTGSGAATVRSVHGAAVAWNQKVSVASEAVQGNASTIQKNGNTVTTRALDSATTYFGVRLLNADAITVGHKYLFACDVDASSLVASAETTNYRSIDFGQGGFSGTVISGNSGTVNSGRIAFIYEAQSIAVMVSYVNASARSGGSLAGQTFSISNPMFFDLTQMFGSGNEPSTVAEFEAMYPEAYYPYSAPTLKPVQIAGIASTDAQGGELDAIEWPAQTLWGAGTIGDMLYSDRKETKVGLVDLGTLTWYKADDLGGAPVYYATLANIAAAANIEVVSVSCAALTGVTASYLYAHPSEMNLVSLNAQRLLWVRHAAADAAAFKTAMQGVMLTYPIATPTTTPISPALPMTYRVEHGGSESIIVPDGEISAAPVLTVAEGESAGELVMDALACIAAPDGPVATANHAQNTYLTMGGKLYKVTSAIAVGESIVAGTNVTETTVMAEVLSLIQ